MPTTALHLLHVEDDPIDAEALRRTLRRGPFAERLSVTLAHAPTLQEALDHLESSTFDIILLDLGLPDQEGLSSLEAVLEAAPNLPTVVLTGRNDFDVAVRAVKAGAQDYLFKGNLDSELLYKNLLYAIERKRMTQELADRTKELEALSESLRQANEDLELFNVTLSHDLKNPLFTVISYGSLLSDKLQARGDMGELNSFAAEIIKAGERVNSMLDTLAELARARHAEVRVRACDLNDLARTTLEHIAGQVQARGARVRYGSLPTIYCDAALLRILLRNLITNAIKYCKRRPEITIGAEVAADGWFLSIADNGIGIPEAYRTKVFDRYTRVDESDRMGTGLGLTLCRTIAERHGGRIWLRSTVGVGTTFFLFIPFPETQPAPPTTLTARV